MRDLATREDGTATTEWAVLLPVLLLLVMLTVQHGLLFHAGQVADAAADEGLETAQAERGSAAAGRGAAQRFADGDQVLERPQVTADRGAAAVTVTVTGQVPSLIPGMDQMAVSRTASGPTEQFRPAP